MEIPAEMVKIVQDRIEELSKLPAIHSRFVRQVADFGAEKAVQWLTQVAIASLAASDAIKRLNARRQE